MKKKVLSALLVTCLVLTGCATGKKSNETSDWDEGVESSVNDATEDPTTEDGNAEESAEIEETTAFSDTREREEVASGSVPIILNDMTADEIVATFDDYTKIYEGDIMEDYAKRFDREPTGIDVLSINFFDNEPEVNYVFGVSVSAPDIATEKELIFTERSAIKIQFKLADVELAQEVYQKVIDKYLVNNENIIDVRSLEDEWYATDNYAGVNLYFQDEGARMSVIIPLFPPEK